MKPTHILIVSLVFIVNAACTLRTGTTIADYPWATGPEGAGVRVSVLGTDSVTEYEGELLETRPDAFLILTRSKAVRKSAQTLQSRKLS